MFFNFWQSTRTPFLHFNPHCCWLSHNIAAYPPPSQGSKLWRPISNAWCNHIGFCHSHIFLRYSIGGDKPTDSQHKIPPYTLACVYHFGSFSLRLAATDYCTSLWIAHPRFMGMHISAITLWLSDSPVIQWSYYKCIQHNQWSYF